MWRERGISARRGIGYGGEGNRRGLPVNRVLDVKGLACPLPVLRAKKAMREVAPGETHEVLATDPGAAADFKAFCQTTGHALVETREEAGVFAFVIRRKG